MMGRRGIIYCIVKMKMMHTFDAVRIVQLNFLKICGKTLSLIYDWFSQ